ncbi:MAG: methyltransferase domain-containing protein [Bryobacteraceae bacterium]
MEHEAKTGEALAFTGERVVPGRVEPDLWNEHISRYRFAAVFAAGKRVLDAGCGTGYGTAILAAVAKETAGFDISREAIEYASSHYPEARFLAGSAEAFPAGDGSADLVTAFEIIEHLTGWGKLVEEAHRVLAPGGMFLVSTPNKVDYAEARKGSGPNPFHVYEFELAAFKDVLAGVFPFVRILGQNQQEAIVFAGEQAESAGLAFVADAPRLEAAQFFLAVCAKQPVEIPSFIYAGGAGNLLRERERWALSLDRELGDARAKIDELHRELEERTGWARGLESELAAARQDLQAAEGRAARLMRERDLVRSSRWVRLGRRLNLGPDLGDERL